MGSNPIIGTSKKTIYLGKLVRGDQVVVREWSRTKTHEKTVYSSSNRQVNACKPEFRYCDSSGAFWGARLAGIADTLSAITWQQPGGGGRLDQNQVAWRLCSASTDDFESLL